MTLLVGALVGALFGALRVGRCRCLAILLTPFPAQSCCFVDGPGTWRVGALVAGALVGGPQY